MKKLDFRPVILLSLGVMIGILLFPIVIKTENKPAATAGTINLAGFDWEKDGTIDLEGEWKYTSGPVSSNFMKEDFDDSSWELLTIPSPLKNALGTSYYRLHVQAEDLSGMAIYCEKIYSAYDLYINGKPVLAAGTVGPEKQGYIPQMIPQFSEFSADADIVIAIKVVNYENPWSSIGKAPTIGNSETLTRERFRRTALDLIILGCLIMTGLYHLFLRIRWKKDNANLFFSLLCLIASLYLAGYRNYFYQVSPIPNTFLFHLALKIQHISISLLPVMLASYFHSLFPKDFSRLVLRTFQTFSMLFVFILVVAKASFSAQLLYVQMFFNSVQFIWISICLIIAVVRERKYAQSFLFGYFIVNAASLNDFFAEFNITPTIVILPIAIALFIVIQSGILSTIFIREFNKSELLGLRLAHEVEKKKDLLFRQQQELESALQNLKNNECYKNDFIRNISTTLRIPLSGILENLDLFENNCRIKTSRQTLCLLSVIRKNSQHLDRLIEQLMDLTRIESGKESLNLNDDDIVSFIEDIVSHYQTSETENRVKFEIEKSPSDYSFHFDADKMEKVLRNLLSNALKFSDETMPVIIRLDIPPVSLDIFTISIKDSGPGIPAEKIPYIFNRFYQLDDSSSRENQGLGIGLALVKEYVEMHHGSVRVDCGKGGSEFIIELPLEDIQIPDFQNARIFRNPPILQTSKVDTLPTPCRPETETANRDLAETILIVEDNHDLREYMIMNLKEEYHISSAENGQQALEVIQNKTVDIVISDIMMPKMDGFEFREALLKMDQALDIPFLFLSAKAEITDQLKGLELGAVDYIVKPFQMEKLRNKIKAMLMLQKAQKEQWRNSLEDRISGFIDPRKKQKSRYMDDEELFFRYNLSHREKEIILVLKNGLKNNEIADHLSISPATVKNHISSIFTKCQVKNRMELISLFT